MSEKKEKTIRMTDAPKSEPRNVFEGADNSSRMTDANTSEPRKVIKHLIASKKDE